MKITYNLTTSLITFVVSLIDNTYEFLTNTNEANIMLVYTIKKLEVLMVNNKIIDLCWHDDETRELLNKCAEEAGFVIEYGRLKGRTEQDLIDSVKGYVAVIAGDVERFTRPVLEAIKDDMKAVMRFGVGYDKIDTVAARDLGIDVIVAGGGNSTAVADIAVMYMLALGRQICNFDKEVRQGIWKRRKSPQLFGKTVGIIGFGRIGRIVASYLSGFKCRILVYDKYLTKNVFARYGVEESTLDEIARTCDYVTLHTPLNPETRGMIDKDFFSKMKPTAYLINTSRGPVVNTADLYDALANNVIAGAGIDVFDEEPINKDSPLLTLDNIVLSPHVAYNTNEANALTSEILIDNLSKALKGEYCEDIVNR